MRDIPNKFMDTKLIKQISCSCRRHIDRSSTFWYFLSQLNSVSMFKPYFSKMHLNTTVRSTHNWPKCLLLLKFSDQNVTSFLLPPYMLDGPALSSGLTLLPLQYWVDNTIYEASPYVIVSIPLLVAVFQIKIFSSAILFIYSLICDLTRLVVQLTASVV